MDIVLAVLIFMVAFIFFYVMLTNGDSTISALKKQGISLISQVMSHDSLFRITDNNEINDSKLGALKNMSYNELQRAFGIQSDFCMYIEDENGKVVLINDSYNKSYKGIGSPDITISGTPCDEKW